MKVIVIGNSRDLLDRNDGQRIDEFDRIVRINSFRLSRHEAQVGSRIDIVCICLSLGLLDSALVHSADLISQARELWTPSWRGHTSDENVKTVLGKLRRKPDDLIFCDDTGHKDVVMRIYDLNLNSGQSRGKSKDGGASSKFFPTTGFQTIHLAEARFPEADLYITGFGLSSLLDLRRFDTSGVGIWPGHDIPGERQYLINGIKEGRWAQL